MSVSGPKNPPSPSVRAPTPAAAPPPAAKADPVIPSKPARAPESSFSGHTAAIDLGKTQNATAIRAQGKVVADTVMQVIGTYDKNFLLATGGRKFLTYMPITCNTTRRAKARPMSS